MYFTLTYDILATDSQEKEKIKDFIKSCFEGLYWVKPISNYYVVKCEDERIRKKILKKLIDFAKENYRKIRFIISPLVDSGQVVGMTATDLWPHLKNITQTQTDDFLE